MCGFLVLGRVTLLTTDLKEISDQFEQKIEGIRHLYVCLGGFPKENEMLHCWPNNNNQKNEATRTQLKGPTINTAFSFVQIPII